MSFKLRKLGEQHRCNGVKEPTCRGRQRSKCDGYSNAQVYLVSNSILFFLPENQETTPHFSKDLKSNGKSDKYQNTLSNKATGFSGPLCTQSFKCPSCYSEAKINNTRQESMYFQCILLFIFIYKMINFLIKYKRNNFLVSSCCFTKSSTLT